MKTAFVVLGMHRSGTSSTAGTLALLGARPPRTLMGPAEDNPRGFWESHVVMALNDRLLARAGSAWNDPRPLDAAAFESDDALRREALDALEGEFGGAATIVLKDPRICRFYPFWRGVLVAAGYRPLIVSPIRAPGEVAASLQARNALTRDQALDLWLRHVLDAEAASRDDPRCVFAWTDLIGDWRGLTTRMEARLGRSLAAPDPAAIDAFLSADLRRHRVETGDLPPRVAEAHAALLALARDGENAEIHRRLDAVRAGFDAGWSPPPAA